MKKLLIGLLALGSVSSYAQMTVEEVKDFMLANRKVSENYKEGNQVVRAESGLSECNGEMLEFKTVSTKTILKIIESKAYYLEERDNEFCSGKYKDNEKQVILRDLELITYKEVLDGFDMPSSDLEKLSKLSDNTLSYKEEGIIVSIDYSVAGGITSGKITQSNYVGEWKESFKEYIAPSTLNVDGLKIKVDIPLENGEVKRITTDFEMKDILNKKVSHNPNPGQKSLF